MVRKYYQDITDLRNKYNEKQRKYKDTYNRLLHASTGASSVGVISGVSTIGTAFTVVGLPISASLGVVSTVSTCAGGILLLIAKKYKKKLLKCYELLEWVSRLQNKVSALNNERTRLIEMKPIDAIKETFVKQGFSQPVKGYKEKLLDVGTKVRCLYEPVSGCI